MSLQLSMDTLQPIRVQNSPRPWKCHYSLFFPYTWSSIKWCFATVSIMRICSFTSTRPSSSSRLNSEPTDNLPAFSSQPITSDFHLDLSVFQIVSPGVMLRFDPGLHHHHRLSLGSELLKYLQSCHGNWTAACNTEPQQEDTRAT